MSKPGHNSGKGGPIRPIIRRMLEGRARMAELDREIRAIYRLVQKEFGLTTAEFEREIVRLREADGRFAKNKVYFARLLSRDAVKIGVTSNLDERLKALPYTLQTPVELVGVIDGDGVTERVVHQQFRAHSLSGEVFLWSPIEAAVRDMISRNSAMVRQ